MSDAASEPTGGLRRVGRAGMTLAGGEVLSKALVFVRNAVVANIISREDFGLAATFALTISALELASDVGVRQFVIQHEDGEAPVVQRAAHMWQLVRGVGLALLLFLTAPLIASLFGAPEAVGDFRVLAVVPALRGLVHLDVARFERSLRFRPSAVAEVGSEAAATVAAVAFAVALGDQRAILFALVARAVASWLITRLVSERPYGIRSDRATFRSLVGFGWPLLINGLVIFAIMQGDRLLVGTFYDLSDLAGYSIAFGLAVVPSLVLARVNGRILLPLLAEARGDEARFRRAYDLSTEIQGFVASLVAAGFLTVGPVLLVLVYGEQYADAAGLLGILGAMQSVRLLRIAPSQAALARGETMNTMQANTARLVGLGVALWLAIMEAPLYWIAVSGLVAESVALVTATLLLARTHGIPARLTLMTALRSAIVPAVAAVAVLVLGEGDAVRIGVGAVAAAAVLVVTTTKRTRRWLVTQLRRLRGRHVEAP